MHQDFAGAVSAPPTAKILFVTFALVTSLFLLWGFCNGMIDILNKHFQDSLHINKEQSGLVQFGQLSGLLPDGDSRRIDCAEVRLQGRHPRRPVR
jgi:hypothetical protein